MSEADNKEFKDHISSREFKKQATEIWKQHKVDSKQTPERKAYDKAMKYEPKVDEAQKRIRKTSKTKTDVDGIVNSLSKKDKKYLGVNKNGEYLTTEEGEHVIKRILLKEGKTPVAFFDVFDEGTNSNGKTNVSVALAVSGDKHGKGYGTKVAKKGSDWIDKHSDEFGMVWWTTDPSNTASQKLAKNNGFKYSKKDSSKEWKIYRKQ